MDHIDTSSIPQSCRSEQLFQDAEEVVTLTTDVATLDDQFDRLFFGYLMEAPHGLSDRARDVYALQQIKEKHGDTWAEIDTKRARLKGLLAKCQIAGKAYVALGIEQGVMIPQ